MKHIRFSVSDSILSVCAVVYFFFRFFRYTFPMLFLCKHYLNHNGNTKFKSRTNVVWRFLYFKRNYLPSDVFKRREKKHSVNANKFMFNKNALNHLFISKKKILFYEKLKFVVWYSCFFMNLNCFGEYVWNESMLNMCIGNTYMENAFNLVSMKRDHAFWSWFS